MIDQVGQQCEVSVRHCCRVLGTRCQTYYRRRKGHRPEVRDSELEALLRRTTARFLAWGFWMIFYFLRNQRHTFNHKRVYRIWKEAGLHLSR